MFENVETKHKSTACGVMNCFDTITLAVTCTYFLFHKNWFPLYLFMTVLYLFCYLLVTILLPESPRWFLIKGDMTGALKSFDYISRLNRSKNLIPRHSKFVEFIIAQNLN